MARGVDYGMGQTNIDTETGIRFGVIPMNDLMGECWDSFEAEYPEDADEDSEPIAHVLNGDGYLAILDGDGDVFIQKSLFFTHAGFCSPCAPGACHLRDAHPDGEKCYCLGHDWFENGKAPYPIYRVADGSEVLPDNEDSIYTRHRGEFTS